MIITVSVRNPTAGDASTPASSHLIISDSIQQLGELRMKEHAFRRLFGSAAIKVSGRLHNAIGATFGTPPMATYRMLAWIGNDRLLVTPVGVDTTEQMVLALAEGNTLFYDMMQARPDEPAELPAWADAQLCGQCGALLVRKPADPWHCSICGFEAKS